MAEVVKIQAPAARAQSARTDALALALRDAAIAGLVALALSVPILSHQTVQEPAKLVLESRWWLALSATATVFVGRLLLNLFVWQAPATQTRVPWPLKISLPTADTGKWLAPVLVVLAIVFPFLPFANQYFVDLAILVLTYIMLGWGLNVVVGLAGLLDLGYVAFYAVGAYSYALLGSTFGWSFWVCLPLAGILAAFWGILLGFPVLRLRGDYLAIVTLAFGEIIRVVLLNWQDFTGGPNGITNIPRPGFFGLEFKNDGPNTFAGYFGIEFSPIHRVIYLYYIILTLALITNFITIRLRRLPIGRAWEALREDEIASRALGLNSTNTKLSAFAIGAMFGGFAGSFFATRQGFVSPESFVFMESATVLAIVVLGGMGSQLGVVVAAIALVAGLEFLRELEFLKYIFGPDFDPTQYRMIVFGLAMVGIMLWRPRGLIATRTPSVVLKERKAIDASLVKE
ncbi:MAG: high-affinity branched-chain amino acid ABC transporter permease LivM, partial [Hyphomicrobiaceae bacterium]